MIFFNFSEYDCKLFQQEIVPHVGKFCKHKEDLTDICDGTKSDCVPKGKEVCLTEKRCYGIMYDKNWASTYHGVKMCTSWALEDHSGKDWSIFMKCKSDQPCPV